MSYPVNDYLLKVIMEERTRRYIRDAEIDHLLSEINPGQPSGLFRQVHKMLHNSGHLLVTLGQRLDRIEMRPA